MSKMINEEYQVLFIKIINDLKMIKDKLIDK